MVNKSDKDSLEEFIINNENLEHLEDIVNDFNIFTSLNLIRVIEGQILQYSKGYAILATLPEYLLRRSLSAQGRGCGVRLHKFIKYKKYNWE